MKKLFPVTCAVLILISCTRAGSLPSSDVLKKAGDASQALQSATFTMDTSFKGKVAQIPGSFDGSASIAGQMANAGKQLQFSINATIDKTDPQNVQSHIALTSDMMIGSENEIYMRVNTLDITPPSTLMPPALITQLLNQWWLIPSGTGSSKNAPTDLAPDPSLLRMQTSVIAVTKDHGLTGINGHTAYLYDVTLDPEKMRDYLTQVVKAQGRVPTAQELALSEVDAQGRIWIDADTFVIHRIVWDITSKDQSQPLQLHVDVTITDHNKPITIAPPQTAVPFPGVSGSLFPLSDTTSSVSAPQQLQSGSGSSSSL
jgi:hypothetical protein